MFFLGEIKITLKCLSIGTPYLINFPFVSNGKLMVFRCPNIQAHYNEAVLCLNFGTPENNEFSIWNKKNGKFIIFSVPILKHIRVGKETWTENSSGNSLLIRKKKFFQRLSRHSFRVFVS